MAPEAVREQHEEPAVNTRRVLGFVGVFVAFALLLAGGLRFYYVFITRGEAVSSPVHTFPAPQLQPDPGKDYAGFVIAQRQQLEGYGWVNRGAGTVHVPIAQAMAIVAARGSAAYDPVEGTPAYPQPGQPPLDGAPRATPQTMAAPFGNEP